MQDAKKVQDKVFQYDPKQAGLSVPIINILLCGGVGAGKSSIISLTASVRAGYLGGHLTVKAQAH